MAKRMQRIMVRRVVLDEENTFYGWTIDEFIKKIITAKNKGATKIDIEEGDDYSPTKIVASFESKETDEEFKARKKRKPFHFRDLNRVSKQVLADLPYLQKMLETHKFSD